MTVLSADAVTRHYPVGGGALLKAVDGVSFKLAAGRTLAVVGESGCGKSTLARVCCLQEPPTTGEIAIAGKTAGKDRALQLQNQMVFQNPYGSLNPRRTIGAALVEPLAINKRGSGRERVAEARRMLERVGLRGDAFDRYPHMFSGGQRQRVAIARALMLRPAVVTADEPVSALDLSVQAQVLNLLRDLQDRYGLTYLFISHDLNVVEYISDRVLVMYLGRVVETGPVEAIYAAPAHPYTRALLRSKPTMDPDRRTLEPPLFGDPPNPIDPPSGCRFRTRCSFAQAICAETVPELAPPINGTSGEHFVACHVEAAQVKDE
jgi:oligopeptide/dipeptide ABC transporter ATP-binding protein